MQSPYTTQQTPPKKSNFWKWLLVTVVGLLFACGVSFVACTALVSGVADDIEKEQTAKISGVKIAEDGCRIEQASSEIFSTIKVDLVINNTTKNQQSYFIDLFIKDEEGVRLANGTAMVTDVRPGQEARHTETIFLTSKLEPNDRVQCFIDKVS